MQESSGFREAGRGFKWLLTTASVVTLVYLGGAAIRENFRTEWRGHQLRYRELLREKARDDAEARLAATFEIKLRQIYVPELAATDRCVSCHVGYDDPRMIDAPQPLTTHPGDYLTHHPGEQFGCTICHQGQGLATTQDDAHGHVPFWTTPLLPRKHLEASCAKCHQETLVAGHDFPQTPTLSAGKRYLYAKGCLGCHQVGDQGGTAAPALTREGNKEPHDFDFAHVSGDHSVINWHYQHFANPTRVSPGTGALGELRMPDYGLSDEQITGLTSLMLALRKDRSSLDYLTGLAEKPQPADGEELFSWYCAACHWRTYPPSPTAAVRGVEHFRRICASCHGRNGEGGSGPALNNETFLSTASNRYLRQVISYGIPGTKMRAMRHGENGVVELSAREIEEVIAFLRTWQHPDQGIGPALQNLDFLAVASQDFIRRQIAFGRTGRPMTAWGHRGSGLSDQEMDRIADYINSFRPQPPSFEQVQRALVSLTRGASLYRAHCAGCHGHQGEGGIGPALHNQDFLRRAGDQFLYRSLVLGRPDTAMPSWSHLSARDIGSLIRYLRRWQRVPSVPLSLRPVSGDPVRGQRHYVASCAQCHGSDGQGGTGPALSNAGFLAAARDEFIRQTIRHGRSGTAMTPMAKGQQGVVELNEAALNDVVAFIRSWKGRRNLAPAQGTVQGNPVRGQALFERICVACHGPEGRGAYAPALNNPGFLAVATDGFIQATLVRGRAGTPMRSFVKQAEGIAPLSRTEINDLVAYIRSWQQGPTRRDGTRVAAASDQLEARE